jgi:hypothetical protein
VANALSAEQAKAVHITAMGHGLGSAYDALWQRLALLHKNWSEYLVLFGTMESRVMLMNKAAPSFTRLVQDALWEKALLDIARIIDRPETAGKSNLTIQVLPRLIKPSRIQDEVSVRVAEALSAGDFCIDWRNRRIAHCDLHLAVEPGAVPLKSASRQKVREVLSALDAVLNTVSRHYLESTTHFALEVSQGGAMSLLQVIDAGLTAELAKHERRHAGIFDPEDYCSRDI